MNDPHPFGIHLYEICNLGSSISPFVVAASAYVAGLDAFESVKDAYFGLYEVVVHQLSETLGPPVFDNGRGCKGYPPGFSYDFIAVWHHAGRVKFIGLSMDETECVCSLELGVTE